MLENLNEKFNFFTISDRKTKFLKISELTFQLGLFLLPSTLSLGIVMILTSSIVSLFFKEKTSSRDKSSILLIIISLLMFVSCAYQTLSFSNQAEYDWDISLTWIGLLNWIPFFFLFWSAQIFLKTNSQRIRAAKLLISGTIPIVITGFGQYFLNWEGPFRFLFGTIIWYLKPLESPLGLSGLFSNQNYAGTWMSTIWPLLIGILFLNKKKIYKRSIIFFILIVFTLTTILTTSRNAILGIIISIPIVLGIKSLFIITTLLLLILLVGSLLLQFPPFLSENLLGILPEQFINKFNKIGFNNLLEYRRINLWNNTINLLIKKPIFGYGAAFFPIIYAIKYSDPLYTEQHAHNIFLELASSYGLIISILLIYFISSIFIKAYKIIRSQNYNYQESIFNKSWFASCIIVILSQMNDITYYDGRISVIFWLLLAGLNNIEEKVHTDTNSTKMLKNL